MGSINNFRCPIFIPTVFILTEADTKTVGMEMIFIERQALSLPKIVGVAMVGIENDLLRKLS